MFCCRHAMGSSSPEGFSSGGRHRKAVLHFTCAHTPTQSGGGGRAKDRHTGDIHSALHLTSSWQCGKTNHSELGRLWGSNDYLETPGASPREGEALCPGPCLVMGREAREAQGPRPQGECQEPYHDKMIHEHSEISTCLQAAPPHCSHYY